MLNHVVLLGRLAQEPEIRYTPSGKPVANFDLAVPVPSKDKNTQPDYLPIVAWDNWAEFCGKYLTKGRQVVVEGRITTRKWTEKETGKHRKAVEITTSRIYFADSNTNGGGGANGSTGQPSTGDGFMEIPEGAEGALPWN
ncbi:MAG: single-stranded DNA-binding protein [Lachnospiraceae bacterium]|nr:single-stranded DNA-binding protein [Lachnospiraceae bacterium]